MPLHNEQSQVGSVDSPKKPILSLILCSRNDQYMGNSRWRLQTALNYVAQNAHELNREQDVEVLVTDWGSEIPLPAALQLTPIAARMVAFVLVPPELAQELQKDSPFSEVHALNGAARRANGQYIGRIDQDILVGKRFLAWFFDVYEGTRQLDVPLESALLFANRRSIPYRFAVRCPSFWAVDRFVHCFGGCLPVETPGWTVSHPVRTPGKPFFDAPVGTWLLHRDVWHECGGYDERMIYMNEMEIDMVYRLIHKYRLVHVEEHIACGFYHLEHYHPHKPAITSRRMNPEEYSGVFHPNNKGWGLAQYPLDVVHSTVNQAAGETVPDSQRRAEWLAFALALMGSGAQIACDHLYSVVSPAYAAWRGRARVVREALRGRPLLSWPRLLGELLATKRRNRQLRDKNQP